jgi:VRR-NUC domain-containing protein
MASDYAHSRVRAPKARWPTEAQERKAIVEWCRVNQGRYPALELLSGIHNELPFVRAAVTNRFMFFKYLREMGHRAGLPDLLLPISRHGYLCLWIEVKRVAGSTVSPEQRWWHHQLRQEGHDVLVAKGADPAIERLRWYVTGPKTFRFGESGKGGGMKP